ncbi:MAG: porin family protein [Bacteroidia bacterium]
MKKFTILMAIAALFSTAAIAQTSFGPVVGLNLSNLTKGDFEEAPDLKIGFHIGGKAAFEITENFIISPELLFSIKGAKVKDSFQEIDVQNLGGVIFTTTTTEEGEANLSLSYIEIPIWALYRLESGLNFGIAPYVGILAGVKTTDEGTSTTSVHESSGNTTTTTTTSYEFESTETDGYSGVDFGVGFGVGYMMERGFGVQLHYKLGLGDIFEENPGKSISNSVIGISLSYMFGN